MKIFIGADHRGFTLKEALKPWLTSLGHDVTDCGNTTLDPLDDYPDFTFPVADAVANDSTSRGIVICGSGGGVTIAANKVKGIRCVLGINPADVTQNRTHNDINVLAIAADNASEEAAKQMITSFLTTAHSTEEKYGRRIQKIAEKEQ